MAGSAFPEVFEDVQLVIDSKTFVDPQKIKNLIKKLDLTAHNRDSDIVVKGSFSRIELLCMDLSGLEKKKTSGGHTERRHVNHYTSPRLQSATTPEAEPVDVDPAVMHYISVKHSVELDRMKRAGVDISKCNRHVSFGALYPGDERTVQAQFARERFTTFYQKIATGLQSKAYSLSSREKQLLSTVFPELLMSNAVDNEHTVMLTGSNISLQNSEQFLHSSRSRINHTDIASASTSSPPAQPSQTNDKEEICCICLEPLVKSLTLTLEKCKHSFCRDCLKRAFEIKPVCPTCGVLYGALKGTQPDGGKMEVMRDQSSLPGYRHCGTIIINYYIPSGTQGDEHPNPGQPYQGASRTAYLPDSTEGKKVCKLLKQAFDQRLIFTIGISSTTGRSNVVTWNDIHHKTSQSGGPTGYGYPDPDYLKRVQAELKAKGIY